MLKTKGSIAELIMAAKVMSLGWNIYFPYGENSRCDFVAAKDGKFIRVQVKSSKPKRGALTVQCRSCNNWSMKSYTSKDIDCMAIYDSINQNAYFMPVSKINKTAVNLRLEPSKNNQRKRIQYAHDFVNFPF